MVDLKTPILRNDEQSLEERMNYNGYHNVLPARYMSKDESGNIIESQEGVFARVAKNVSVAEALHVHDRPDYIPLGLLHDHFSLGDYSEYVEGDEIEFSEDTACFVSYDKLKEYLFDDYIHAHDQMVEWKEEFEEIISHLDMMPNTPTLINAGNELQQLSACFVLDIDDDMRDIHEVGADAAEIFQAGGGLGYPFSFLRPYGDQVGSTGGVASGPISFMQTLDQICSTIAQGGIRRGAQMGVMHVWHPDIPFFLHSKRKDVSLAQTLLLNDPDDPTHNSFSDALEEARDIIDEEGRVPSYLRNAVEGHLSNFNISVAVTDEFMDCLHNGEEFTLKNPRTDEVHIANEKTKELWSWFGLGEYVEVGEELSVPAEVLWEKLIEGAHENGEPGVIYIDRVNKHNSFDVEKHPEYCVNATNPCGEEPLFDGDACNLNHINLSTIVSEDVTPWIDYDGNVEDFLDQAIDWEELERRVEIGTRFLDNVVTMSNFPVEKIHNTVKENRKIGLGIMGLAQLMIQVGIEYGSEESQKLSEEVMKFIHHQSKHVSNELAYQRGAFDNFDDSKWSDINSYPEWFEHHAGFSPEEHGYNDFLQRNHETTTVAPTGTTSILANTSGGCEPIFNVVYFKNVTDDVQGDEMMVEFDNLFLKTLEENDIDVEKVKKEAIELMNNNEYEKPSDIPSVPDDLGDLFVTTNELSSKQHASVQCAIQKGCGSGISKTVNAPNDATIEDAKLAFEYIYDNGGKSVTYYRDGSRTKQVNTVRKDNQEVESEESEPREEKVSNPLSRSAPKVASGVRYEINTGYGDMFVNIVEDEHGPVELIANVGKSGGTVQSMTEAIGRLVSKSLQNGVDPEDIINQLENIHSPKKSWDGGEGIESIPDGIATALRRYGDDMNHKTVKPTNFDEVRGEEQKSGNDGDECLECGAMAVRYDGGCPVCESCGWSKC